MKVLLTGAHGFLGSHIKAYWESSGHQVICLGRSTKNDIQCDLSKQVPHFDFKADYVIHAAGKAHIIPKSENEKREFHTVNVLGTENLLKAVDLMPQKPKALLFVSSASVYGLQTGINIKEESPLKANDSYGKSKIEGEEMILKWGREKEIISSAIRPPLIIGKNAPGNLQTMIKAIKTGRYRNIGKGTAKRSMVLAEDIAEFSPILLEKGGVYNLTDNEDPSFKSISEIIGKRLGKKVYNLPILVAKIIALAGDILGFILKKEMPFSSGKLKKMTKDLTLDSTKANSIGWKPRSVIQNHKLWL